MTENGSTGTITAYTQIPYAIIKGEVEGTSRAEFQEELGRIVQLYEIYDKGSDFITEGTNLDYVSADLRYKKAKTILNKEARFLFSKSPDYRITPIEAGNETDKKNSSILQNLVDKVLKSNKFSDKLLKASKDCFIGKRVACMLNFNSETGIKLTFLKSLDFYYETESCDIDVLSKIVTFAKIHESRSSSEVRIFKKKYWMENGYCCVEEIIYDGSGKEIEIVTPAQKTLFTYIPAVVIVNDGLTGDLQGESEIESLSSYESWYSRLANADMDAERKSMNPIKYAIDCDPESTTGLSSSAGSFWDLSSDENSAIPKQGSVGQLESTMAYKDALKTTLDRIDNTMYEQVDVPNISSEALQGVVTSGKTLKAIYWPLLVRCDEKMLTWRPALEFLVDTIIQGSFLYPDSAKVYIEDKLPDMGYEVSVENNYPLPEDEAEEKTIDLSEVTSLTMSRKTYMKKWRGLTDEEADEELKQLAKERELLENSFSVLPPTDSTPTDTDDKATVEDTEEGKSAIDSTKATNNLNA